MGTQQQQQQMLLMNSQTRLQRSRSAVSMS
jgi:hypothetical protein